MFSSLFQPQPTSPNHALQRTATLAFSYRSAAGSSTGSVTACAPAMKPGTCRAFASPRRAHTRALGPRSLSWGSLGHMSTRILFLAVLVSLMAGCVCDFEGVETQRVAVRDVSDRALAAFVRTYPGETVEQVETHTFKRKIVRYTVTFQRAGSSSHRVEFTRDGVVIPPPVDVPERLR